MFVCSCKLVVVRRLEVEKLRMIVRHVIQFITIRQFPPADKSLPPLSKSRWWIATGTKTLALVSKYCQNITLNTVHCFTLI
jgi:hypothetical protein